MVRNDFTPSYEIIHTKVLFSVIFLEIILPPQKDHRARKKLYFIIYFFFHFLKEIFLFFEVTTTPANPKEYFYARDETETNAQTQQATCITNKCDKGNGYVSFDFGDIWTLYHHMNQSQVLPSIFIHLFS